MIWGSELLKTQTFWITPTLFKTVRIFLQKPRVSASSNFVKQVYWATRWGWVARPHVEHGWVCTLSIYLSSDIFFVFPYSASCPSESSSLFWDERSPFRLCLTVCLTAALRFYWRLSWHLENLVQRRSDVYVKLLLISFRFKVAIIFWVFFRCCGRRVESTVTELLVELFWLLQ